MSSRPNIIVRPPSAELRENQKDQDSLPPYPILDAILYRLVEKEMRVADIVAEGYDAANGAPGRAAALSRRIQAPAVRAGREGRPEEFRPRPALSDRQPLPRFRRAAQAPDAGIAPRKGQGTSETVRRSSGAGGGLRTSSACPLRLDRDLIDCRYFVRDSAALRFAGPTWGRNGREDFIERGVGVRRPPQGEAVEHGHGGAPEDQLRGPARNADFRAGGDQRAGRRRTSKLVGETSVEALASAARFRGQREERPCRLHRSESAGQGLDPCKFSGPPTTRRNGKNSSRCPT